MPSEPQWWIVPSCYRRSKGVKDSNKRSRTEAVRPTCDRDSEHGPMEVHIAQRSRPVHRCCPVQMPQTRLAGQMPEYLAVEKKKEREEAERREAEEVDDELRWWHMDRCRAANATHPPTLETKNSVECSATEFAKPMRLAMICVSCSSDRSPERDPPSRHVM